MRTRRSTRDPRWVVHALAAALVAVIGVGCGGAEEGPAAGLDRQTEEQNENKHNKEHKNKEHKNKEVVILFTSDLHDHLMGWSPNADYTPATTGDDVTVGGFARLAARIDAERAAAGARPVLLLDSGDFTMGSLFSWLNTSSAPSLALMQQLGYDAVTLGNHEWDWTPDGLAGTLSAALQGGFSVPVVASNMIFSSDAGDDKIEALWKAGVIRGKLVKTLPNGLKVGIFGLLGDGAQRDTPMADPVGFEEAAGAARAMVKQLRDKDRVDLVICLSHSGMQTRDSGEDLALVEQVEGIDVIISGHSHVALLKPVHRRKTIIVQAGAYGRYLGRLRLQLAGKAVVVKEHALLQLDDTSAGDATVQSVVAGHVSTLDTMLKPMGLGYSKVLAETSVDLTFPPYQEAPLGNLVTDAYRGAVSALQPGDPVDLAVESGGIIRDEVLRGTTGKLWFADLYRALPLGIGTDMVPGHSLVSFYVTGQEVKQGMELTAAARDVLGTNDFFMQVSGVEMTYSTSAPPFGRVTSLKVGGKPVDSTRCYKMVTNYYIAMLLTMVQHLTGGAVAITPREKGCATPVSDLSARVVDYDPATPGVQQLKQWQALTSTVTSFPDADADGIPDIPSSYGLPQGRIVPQP